MRQAPQVRQASVVSQAAQVRQAPQLRQPSQVRLKPLKRECPLGPSHIKNMWHMMKNQNFSYSSQR